MKLKSFFSKHSKTTRSLKELILSYEKKLPPLTFKSFLKSLSDELSAASKSLFIDTPHKERAQKLQQFVDATIAQGPKLEISCKNGCSACCHLEVEVTNYEAEILTQLIRDGHLIDQDRLKKQSERSLQDLKWKQGIKDKENKCVFLNNEGSCSIYDFRPVMCRRHAVTSPAINCETIGSSITVRYSPRVDVLISAANEDPNLKIGPMAKMLSLNLPH